MEPTNAFNLNLAIDRWLVQFNKKTGIHRDDLDEIQSHLLDHIEDLIDSGEPAEKAFQIAISGLGDPACLAREYKKVHCWQAIVQKVSGLSRYIVPSSKVMACSVIFLAINIGSIYGQMQSNKRWQTQSKKNLRKHEFSVKQALHLCQSNYSVYPVSKIILSIYGDKKPIHTLIGYVPADNRGFIRNKWKNDHYRIVTCCSL